MIVQSVKLLLASSIYSTKWLFIYRRDLVVCHVYFIFYFFLNVFVSLKYDFRVNIDRMIVKTREM